jgi:polysaccharide export outer membrane protein
VDVADQGLTIERETSAVVGPAVFATSATSTALEIGDRLQLSVYEKLGASADATAPLLSSLVEHAELSGEYIVQPDGGIFLPFLGHVNVVGETCESLRETLDRMVIEEFKGQSLTTVRLLSREPIYVTGKVAHPGAFKYSPGMVVLNALILAGPLPAGQANWERLDVMRMTEHVQQADLKLANFIAQRDVLIALRDGRSAAPSEALSSLVGVARANRLIAAAVNLFELKEQKYKNDQQALSISRGNLEKERTILNENLNDAFAVVDHAKERLGAMLKLHKTGMTTDSSYYQAVGELDSGRNRVNDLKATLVRLEGQLASLDQQYKHIIADAQLAREQTIADLRAQIAETAVTRDTLRPTLGFDRWNGQRPEGTHYRILRVTAGGIERIDADRFSFLKPGDIVEAVQAERPLIDANAGSQK